MIRSQRSCLTVLLVALLLPGAVVAATSVEARGLMRDMAVLIIDGRQRVLRTGERSPEGVELLEASTVSARIRIGEQEHLLTLSDRVGADFVAPTRRQVQISRDQQGHFRVAGTIQGQPVAFLVDTGATVLAMSSRHAERLGIDYVRDGGVSEVVTAAGPAASYYILLDAVQVGGITVTGVQAAVVEGDYPVEILLGMSFLRHVGMAQNAGVLTLTQEF